MYSLQNSPFGLIVALFCWSMYNYVYVSLSDIHFGNAKVADELMSAGTQVVGLGIRGGQLLSFGVSKQICRQN